MISKMFTVGAVMDFKNGVGVGPVKDPSPPEKLVGDKAYEWYVDNYEEGMDGTLRNPDDEKAWGIIHDAIANGKRPKRWAGTAEKCDICKGDIPPDGVFYDAKTIHGPWGLMCIRCFSSEGIGTGTGLGQEYHSPTMIKIWG